MQLTAIQQQKVQDNLGLVHKVINDKVHGAGQMGIYTHEDLFQIGCIGLCKAVATDKGGTFSTYAYRLIWHEICDALIYATRRQAMETSSDTIPMIYEDSGSSIEDAALEISLYTALDKAKLSASPCVVKGIDAMIKMAHGYSSKEIGDELGVPAKLVCAWISKARKYLQARPEVRALANT